LNKLNKQLNFILLFILAVRHKKNNNNNNGECHPQLISLGLQIVHKAVEMKGSHSHK